MVLESRGGDSKLGAETSAMGLLAVRLLNKAFPETQWTLCLHYSPQPGVLDLCVCQVSNSALMIIMLLHNVSFIQLTHGIHGAGLGYGYNPCDSTHVPKVVICD